MDWFLLKVVLIVTGGVIVPIILVLTLFKPQWFGIRSTPGTWSRYDFIGVMFVISLLLISAGSLIKLESVTIGLENIEVNKRTVNLSIS